MLSPNQAISQPYYHSLLSPLLPSYPLSSHNHLHPLSFSQSPESHPQSTSPCALSPQTWTAPSQSKPLSPPRTPLSDSTFLHHPLQALTLSSLSWFPLSPLSRAHHSYTHSLPLLSHSLSNLSLPQSLYQSLPDPPHIASQTLSQNALWTLPLLFPHSEAPSIPSFQSLSKSCTSHPWYPSYTHSHIPQSSRATILSPLSSETVSYSASHVPIALSPRPIPFPI